MAGTGELRAVAPVLTSYNIDATEAFYVNKLGFSTVVKYNDFGYLIVTRDAVDLHFALVEGGSPETTPTECYINVAGIDTFYAQAQRAGAVHPNGHMVEQPWGMREFVILDPDGNGLRIGEPLPE
nr:bleomycin resistance protein [uncultured bacterium]